MGVNKVILLGNAGSDPKMHFPTSDTQIAYFSLATNETAQGGVARTEWHNIVMTGKGAEQAEKYIRKGARIYVEGKLRTRSYTDRLGIQRTRTEIYADYFELLGRQ